MLDLNDLRVFEKVATLRSFSAAGRVLNMPKSSVSRCVARLEAALGIRLVQRTTHDVQLTDAGLAMHERCGNLLARIHETVDVISGMSDNPRGLLRISVGIGFGYNAVSDLLPEFLARYPDVKVALELSSRSVDLIAENVDVTVRIGPMTDSQLVAVRLGTIRRYLCAAPAYLARRGTPRTLDEIQSHDAVEMPGIGGRPRPWMFTSPCGEEKRFELNPRLSINDPLLIHRQVLRGVGLGCLSGYLCAPDIQAGRLVHLFPEWTPPPLAVNAVFPSRRELSPTVKAFVEHLKSASAPGKSWQDDPMAPP
ncbi:LysR family transcriptional regulator [Ideonella azotifigens]|uniref:LysR family transcriptional regulator n=1 Tax=Ideonella azotifigens TaxID=513160 RepID=A0ABN1KH95_9BURK|nr:LysR family transcriptional regulator [Ideonella azotifigens]MCD2344940.1 LysR family transcriptional regulator [Ideonella azotifigens]